VWLPIAPNPCASVLPRSSPSPRHSIEREEKPVEGNATERGFVDLRHGHCDNLVHKSVVARRNFEVPPPPPRPSGIAIAWGWGVSFAHSLLEGQWQNQLDPWFVVSWEFSRRDLEMLAGHARLAMTVPGANDRIEGLILDVDIGTYFSSSTWKYSAIVGAHLGLEVPDRASMARLLLIGISNIFVVWVVRVEGVESFLPT